ncbi:MAG: hypothetical protein IJX08_04705 [Clostridia bacterium]|nr:hypothetical protein [Clostridia bacterium]
MRKKYLTHFKRLGALTALFCLALSLLASCKTPPLLEPQDPSVKTPSKEVQSSESSFPDDDRFPKPQIGETFDGVVIRFAVCDEGENSRSIDLGAQDDAANAVNVQVKRRNEQVEKELDVKIELSRVVEAQKMISELSPILASNIYTYDVLGLYQYYDLGLCIGAGLGQFYNLKSMPEGYTNYLNLDAAYWDTTCADATYKDATLFATGDLSLSYSGTMYVSFVNADLWAKYADEIAKLESAGGYSDPYEIVKKGYWTMDLLMDLADLAYEDIGAVKGKVDEGDQAGLLTYNESIYNVMTDVLVAGAGLHYSIADPDGIPEVAVNTPENVAFYKKLYTLLCETHTLSIPFREEDLHIMERFGQGNALVTLYTLDGARYLADTEGDYLILPPPMLTSGQYDPDSPSLGYRSQNGEALCQFAICKAIGKEKLPAVTATLELMAYYSARWLTPAYLKDALGARYGDPCAQEMIALTRAGLYTDFVFAWSGQLDDMTRKFRTEYTKGGTQASTNLRGWHRTVIDKRNRLLPSLYEAVYPA